MMTDLLKLTRDNYFSLEAQRQYMSVSQFKGFLPSYGGCEAQSMAKLAGEWEDSQKTAFDEGHFLHAWNEGTLPDFKANNPSIYSSQGPTKGQLKANFKHLTKLIEVLENDPKVMNALAGEKEVIMTASFHGIKWKIMIDSYNPEKATFSDLKGLQSIDKTFWNKESRAPESFIQHYGYDIQMAVYAEIERRATNNKEWLLPHLVVVTKETVPDHDIAFLSHENIPRALNIVANNIERVKAVKSGLVQPVRCEKCDYCKLDKKVMRIKEFSEFELY
ncbi:PD-(D/E)XK nuclease-like domain-containing protein [Paenibacillus sp. FSL R5-0887]|uniref:PD-(D/E)XK nuclease-like domain-containing protein n=1 Tax=Paenibacillus sp. FSL R5-0887 TaxID=2921662 RepID=UPI0030F79B99